MPIPNPSKLTTHPKVWFLECKYCNPPNSRTPTNAHERELLNKADKFCKNSHLYHFREYLQAEFDTLDHAKLDPTGQIEVLNAVHDKTGCDCLTALTAELSIQIKPDTQNLNTPHNSDITTQQLPQGRLSTSTPILSISPNPSESPAPPPSPPNQTQSNQLRTTRHNPPKQATLIDRLKIGPTRPKIN